MGVAQMTIADLELFLMHTIASAVPLQYEPQLAFGINTLGACRAEGYGLMMSLDNRAFVITVHEVETPGHRHADA
jgi:hypothetical protein